MKHLQKYIIITLLFISITSMRLYAQAAPHIWLGGFAGIDIGNITITGADLSGVTFSSKTGFALGAELDDFFSDNFGICAQLAYVQKGVTQNITFGSATITSAATISYLQIPVLLKATFGSGNIKPVFFAGPEIGIKLSGSQKISEGGKDTTESIADSLLTTINLGVMFGAGVTYAINPTTMLFLNAVYDLGLSNLNARYGKVRGGSVDNEKDVTRDIRINLGIVFALGKDND